MIESFEIRGKWYLPTAPRQKVSGTLKFEIGNDPYLEIEGTLRLSQNNYTGEFYTPQIILGISSSGEEITLYKCYEMLSKNFHYAKYHVSTVLRGRHFRQVEDLQIKELRSSFTNLTGWYNRSWIQKDVPHLPNQFSVTTSQPDNVLLASTDRYEISIYSLWSTDSSIDKISVKHRCEINISFKNWTTIDDGLKVLRQLQDFLALAMTEIPSPTSIIAKRGKFKIIAGKIRNKDIQIIFNPILPYNDKKVFSQTMLFTLEEIRNEPQVLTLWLKNYEKLEPVFTLYFSIQHSPFIYLETRFLYLTQAIETYHRTIFGGKYMPDEEFLEGLYLTLIDALPQNLNADFRTSLVKGKFRYANEYSLRKRLNELLHKLDEYFPEGVFRDQPHKKQFIAEVVGNRNYLTHYDKSALEGIEKRSSLFSLEQRLTILIEAIFLREMAFSPETARSFLSNSRAYGFIKSESRQ